MSKKLLGIVLSLLLMSSLIAGCGTTDQDTGDVKAAAVYTNGIIYTVEGKDWDKNAAEAMAVSEDGKILFVGSNEESEDWIGDDTEVIDLDGKTVLPGLVDNHVHPPGTALTELYAIDLYTSFNKDDTLATIEAFIKDHPGVDIYWGEGFNMGMVDENGNMPNKDWLDPISPDIPIILTSNDYHNQWVNSAALEMLGIDANTPTPVGGNIHKDANGNPTGLLTDVDSLITVEQDFSKAQQRAGMDLFLRTMNAWGYTSFCSAMSFIDDENFHELEDSGKLTMRANLSIRMDADDPDSSLEELMALSESFEGSELIKVSTAKFFIDGVVEGVTAYLLEPYTAAAGMGDNYVSEPMWDYDVYEDAMKKVTNAGYQIHVHSIGDAATKMTLDAIEAAQKSNSSADHRNVITHVQLIDKEDFPRFGQLNLIAAIQPFWSLKEPEWYDTVDELVLGEERAWHEYPFASLKKGGAIITSSGDFPVSPINNPFWAIEAASTRNINNAEFYGIEDITDMNDPTWLLNPDERLTVKDMVEAYTINGAYQMFREDIIGSLAPGKEADFIIIDKDIMNIDILDIDSIKVLSTYLSGKAVFN